MYLIITNNFEYDLIHHSMTFEHHLEGSAPYYSQTTVPTVPLSDTQGFIIIMYLLEDSRAHTCSCI